MFIHFITTQILRVWCTNVCVLCVRSRSTQLQLLGAHHIFTANTAYHISYVIIHLLELSLRRLCIVVYFFLHTIQFVPIDNTWATLTLWHESFSIWCFKWNFMNVFCLHTSIETDIFHQLHIAINPPSYNWTNGCIYLNETVELSRFAVALFIHLPAQCANQTINK